MVANDRTDLVALPMSHHHTTTRRVEFADTDMAGIVHFSRFFLWMEQAEHDFLESHGLTVVFEDEGFRHGFPRVGASCDYLAPARYRDILAISVILESVGKSSLKYIFRFHVNETPVAVGRLATCLCRLDDTGMHSIPLPGWMRSRLPDTAG